MQEEEYNLKELDGKIELFKGNTNIYPEEYIEVEKEPTGEFTISEIHRNVKQIKVKTEKDEEAGVYAVIIFKKLFDTISDKNKIRFIRNYVDIGEEEKALACCIDHFDNLIYSIDYEDSLKISLMRSKNVASVKFAGEYLVHNAKLSRGYAVFYNYCEKLQYIYLFYNKIQQKLSFSVSCEKILSLYILGKCPPS